MTLWEKCLLYLGNEMIVILIYIYIYDTYIEIDVHYFPSPVNNTFI